MKRSLFAAAIFAACLSLAQGADQRIVNREQLMQIFSEQTDVVVAQQKADAFLNSLPTEQALQAEADVARWARDNRLLSRTDYAREMLRINRRWAPDDESTLDYWRYMTMLCVKLERNEVSQEEFDYLQGRKLAEARRATATKELAVRREVEAEVAARLREQAAREDQNAATIGSVLRAIGEGLKRPTQPAVDCVTTGITTTCRPR